LHHFGLGSSPVQPVPQLRLSSAANPWSEPPLRKKLPAPPARVHVPVAANFSNPNSGSGPGFFNADTAERRARGNSPAKCIRGVLKKISFCARAPWTPGSPVTLATAPASKLDPARGPMSTLFRQPTGITTHRFHFLSTGLLFTQRQQNVHGRESSRFVDHFPRPRLPRALKTPKTVHPQKKSGRFQKSASTAINRRVCKPLPRAPTLQNAPGSGRAPIPNQRHPLRQRSRHGAVLHPGPSIAQTPSAGNRLSACAHGWHSHSRSIHRAPRNSSIPLNAPNPKLLRNRFVRPRPGF